MEQRRYYSSYDRYDREEDYSREDKRRDDRYGYESNGSAAYDFSLFEGRAVSYSARSTQRKNQQKKTKSSKTAQSQTKNASRSSSKAGQIDRKQLARGVAIGIIFAVAVGALLSCQVEYHELLQEISAANRNLTELQQDYTDLSVAFESKMSNSAIEEYATDVLGMQKRDNSQTEWVTIGGGDVFEYTDGDGAAQWLQDEFDKLLSYMN